MGGGGTYDSSRDICTRELHPPAEDREAVINGRGEPAEAVSEAAKQCINRGEWDIGDEDWPVSREVLLTFIASHSDANADGIAANMQNIRWDMRKQLLFYDAG